MLTSVRPSTFFRITTASLCSLWMLGCQPQSRGRDLVASDEEGETGSGEDAGQATGGDDGDESGEGEGGGGGIEASTCLPEQAGPDQTPLRRLTTLELQRSLPVLFAGVDLPVSSLPPPLEVEGFRTHVLSQPNNELLIESEYQAATQVSVAATAQLSAWAPCEDPTLGCLDEIAEDLAFVAYRRPADDDELDRLTAVAEEAFTASGFEAAVEDLVVATLLSPQFLYRLEVGRPDDADGDAIPLTGYEIATRLSFFLWGVTPDRELLEAAGRGDLDTAEGIAEYADTMVDDARARQAVESFFSQWLRIDHIDEIALNAERFPEFDPSVSEALKGSLERFVRYALWDEQSLDTLFESDLVFVDDTLADLLSTDAPDEGFAATSLAHRRGILTQPGYLAHTSHGGSHSPILRGLAVLEKFLCIQMPAPPPDVNAAVEPPPEGEPITTRDQFEQTHRQPACSGCHDLIDGVGFSFENYDALGRYVTTENGVQVDATGLVPLDGERLSVDDGIELADIVAQSGTVRSCVASQWYRFTFGTGVDGPGGDCEVEQLTATWGETLGDPKAMLTQIVTSNTFRYRHSGS